MSAKPSEIESRSGNANGERAFKSKLSALVCIITTITQTIAFLVFITYWAVVKTSLVMPKESSACIPCDKMMYADQGNAGRSEIRDDGMCCGPVASLAQVMFLQVTADWYDYSMSDQNLIDIADEYADCDRKTNDKRPIAKVVGIVKFKPSLIVKGHFKVMWSESGRTFANNCKHLAAEGVIFIRQSGYYIVSSQLNLRRQNDTSTSVNTTRPMTFEHNVNIIPNLDYPTGALMQTKNTIGKSVVYFTSFLSAVFMLNEYDRLSVSVSHPEMLDIGNPNDHFLVYYTYDLPY